MKYIKDIRLFEDAGKHEFGCAMVFFQLPIMEALHKIIDEDDIYTDPDSDREFGLEKEPHTTLLYGLHPEVADDEVLNRSMHPDPKEILLDNVSCFENEEYDVLKFDAKADWLHECNEMLAELPHTNKFPDYHPHATIGYLKKGTGKKYVEMLKGMQVNAIPEKVVYSKANGDKIEEPIEAGNVDEGTWAWKGAAEAKKLKAELEAFKKKASSIVGDDEFFDGLDAAISRLDDMIANNKYI